MLFRPKLITFAVALAMSAQAQAAVDVASSIAGSITSTGVPDTDTSMSDPGTVPPGQTWIAQYADTGGAPWTGYFGERLSGNTIVRAVTSTSAFGTVTSQIEYRATVTNTGSDAMPLSFLWHIGRGQVSVAGPYAEWGIIGYDPETEDPIYGAIQTGFDGYANLRSEIRWDGQSLWSVDLTTTNSDVSGIATVIDKSASAAGFGTYAHWTGGIGYDEYSGDLGLGMLGAGESKDLVYTITGTVWYASNGCEGCFYGYGGAVVGNTDPFQFEGDEVGRFGPGGVIVTPEPSTYAAMVAGLLGMGALARRRRSRVTGLC
jgi:hypothetical protein